MRFNIWSHVISQCCHICIKISLGLLSLWELCTLGILIYSCVCNTSISTYLMGLFFILGLQILCIQIVRHP